MTQAIRRLARAAATQPVLLALLVLAALAANLRWVATHRQGLPLDIDEAGYLERAVTDGNALDHGLSGLFHVLRRPDPQAPLLPATAGIAHHLTGAGPYRLLVVPQAFYAIALVATYVLARRLMTRNWALLSTAVVAAAPGLLMASRQFQFAIPLTALLTATIAAQLAIDEFRSLPRSLVWGALLGLTTLTRTQALGLLPALLFAGLVRLVVSRPGWVAARNALIGLLVAIGCSAWWYTASWRSVIDYLTEYGYGQHAADYGTAHSVWSGGWWTARLGNLTEGVLFAPIAGALIVCLACAVWRVRIRRGPGIWQFLRTDQATLLIFLVGSYLALSSTRNVGSYFTLPLVPALVVLAVSVAAGAPPLAQRVAATACVVAAAVSFAGHSALVPVPTNASVTIGSAHVPVFQTAGPPRRYATAFRGGCAAITMCTIARPGESADAQLRSWVPPSRQMAGALASWATQHGRSPVVFFAVQDPLFNANTVGLAYLLAYGKRLPTGLLRDPTPGGRSLLNQLNARFLGRPNLVITGPASAVPSARVFSPTVDDAAVRIALLADGFRPVDRLPLPDGRLMRVWWHGNRGPIYTGRPLR